MDDSDVLSRRSALTAALLLALSTEAGRNIAHAATRQPASSPDVRAEQRAEGAVIDQCGEVDVNELVCRPAAQEL